MDAQTRIITKQLISIALPLIASNILQQFYNTVDAFVIGRYADQNSFAAVGIASSVMNLFLFAIVGACGGLSVIFSQKVGQRDDAGFRNQHFVTLVLGLVVSLGLGLLAIIFLPSILHATQVPAALYPYARIYLIIVLAGLPASYLYNLYSAILRSAGRTLPILLILFVSVGLNLALDILFIRNLSFGITGAAAATVIAQAFSALLSILYTRKKMPCYFFRKEDRFIDRKDIKRILHFGGVAGFHQSGLYVGKLLVQAVVNGAGTEIIAAYTATTRIEGFANSFGDSGAAATSVVVAQNTGAGDRENVEKTYRSSLVLLILLGAACSVIMYATAHLTASIMLGQDSGPALENAVQYLKTISIFYVLCFTGNTLAGYYDGIGKVNIPPMGALSHITMRIILSYFWIGHMGLNGVAVATGIGWIWVNFFWLVIKRMRYDPKRRKI